jgi:hypothetical protein
MSGAETGAAADELSRWAVEARMAPFTFGSCPRCSAETRQRFLPQGADGDLTTICETCFTVLTYREDESVECRAATDDEREAVPPPVVWSEEVRAGWRESLRQGRADLRAWVRAGCPGLTPELERTLPPGALDRIRRFVALPEGDATRGSPSQDAEPREPGR